MMHHHQQHHLHQKQQHGHTRCCARLPLAPPPPQHQHQQRQRQQLRARFKAGGDEVEQLALQASAPPVVQLPAEGAGPPTRTPGHSRQRLQQQQGAQQRPQRQRRATKASDHAAAQPQPRLPQQQQQQAEPQQEQQQQQQHLPRLRQRLLPAAMDFATMLAQLAAWRGRHLTAHVPRHCFDAPELGAWVRHLRKAYKEGELEQWKVERLNALCFEWELTQQEARWHHQYHQLRRYRLLHGTAQIDTAHSAHDQCNWAGLDRWLARQSRLLAKQRLSTQKRAMLAQLDVTLSLPRRIVQRTAALQGLNGPERRKLRKRWKLQDNLAAEARWQAARAALQEQHRAEQQLRNLERRRRELRRQGEVQAAHEARARQQQQQQQQHAAAQEQQATAPASSQQQPADHQQQQQQQDAPADAPPLLFARNRRAARVQRMTRHEQWLRQQQQRDEA